MNFRSPYRHTILDRGARHGASPWLRVWLALSTLAAGAAFAQPQPLIDTIAGGPFPNNVSVTTANLRAKDVAADPAGNIYFTVEEAGSVYRLDNAGTLTRVAGTADLTGALGTAADGGPATSARLSTPSAIVWRGGSLFVLDSSTLVRRIDLSSGIISTVAGGGSALATPGALATTIRFLSSDAMALDASGNIYVEDSRTRRILKIDTGGIVSFVAGNGVEGYTGDGGAATAASIGAVNAITVDSAGNVFFYDPQRWRIRKVGTDGIISTIAGNGSFSSPSDGSLAVNSGLPSIQDMVVDSSGNLIFANYSYSRIQRITLATGIVSTVAGRGLSLPYFAGDGGPATAATVVTPIGLGLDSSGNLLIAEDSTYRIRKVDLTTNLITTLNPSGGMGFGGDGGPGNSATLAYASGVARDASGAVYVADRRNHRVRRIDPVSGIITTVAGTGRFGVPQDGIPGTASDLYWPADLAVDPVRNVLYIADEGHFRIRRLDLATGIISTYAGNGINGIFGDGGPASSAGVGQVFSFALDASGNLYLGQINSPYSIRRVDAATGIITTIPATIGYPYSLATDASGKVYVGDSSLRVLRVDPVSGATTPVAGNGTFASTGDGGPAINAAIRTPYGLAFDSAGRLYIGESNGIRRVGTDGIISTIAGGGSLIEDGVSARSAFINRNSTGSMAFDKTGNLLFNTLNGPTGSSTRIRRVRLAVPVTITTSKPGLSITVDGMSTTSPQTFLWEPGTQHTVAAASPQSLGGTLYQFQSWSDGGAVSHTILAPNTDTTITANFAPAYRLTTALSLPNAGSIQISPPSPNGYYPAGTTVTLTTTWNSGYVFNSYSGVTASGNPLTITMTQNYDITANFRVIPTMTVTGPAVTTLPPGQTLTFLAKLFPPATYAGMPTGTVTFYNGATSIGSSTLDAAGEARFYWAAPVGTHTVSAGYSGDFIFNANGTSAPPVTISASASTIRQFLIETVAGNGTVGFSGDGGPALSAQLSNPSTTALDGNGNLYFTDVLNHRVRRVDASTGVIRTLAGTGVQGYSGDGGLATAANLDRPTWVVVDSTGNVYVSDFGNNRVRRIDATTGIITTVLGTGSATFNGDGAAPTTTSINGPHGLKLASDTVLYVAEGAGHRVRRVVLGSSVQTVAGNGTSGYNGDGIAATAARLSQPLGIELDAQGNLLIADSLNRRVRRVDAVTGVISTVAGSGAQGAGGDGSLATSAQLGAPYSVSYDGLGNLFIGDGNATIRMVSSGTGIITKVAGIPYQGGYNGDGIAATGAFLRGEPRVTADPRTGDAYFGDTQNARVRRLTPIKTPSTITLAVSSNAITFGGGVNLTATVSPSAAGGTVEFRNGTQVLGTQTLAAGSAFFSWSNPLAGSYSLTAVYKGDLNYALSTSNAIALTVNQAAQNLTFGPLAAKTFGDAPFTVTATGGASTSPVVFAAAGSCTVAGNLVTITGAGTCSVTANQAGDLNYLHAPSVTQTFAIAKAAATLTLGGSLSQVYDGSPRVVSVLTSPASLSGVTVTYDGQLAAPVNAGSYAVTASLSNANYTALSVSGLLVVAAPMPAGGSTTVTSSVGSTTVTSSFSSVSTSGVTKVTPIPPLTAADTPGGFVVSGANLAFDISTTATYSGSIVNCFVVTSIATQAEFDLLRILHREQISNNPVTFGLVDRTILKGGNKPDFPSRTICAKTSSLSPFYFATVVDQTAPSVTELNLSVNPLPVGSSTVLSAKITDLGSSPNPIALAEYSLDGGTTWHPITANYFTATSLAVNVSLSPQTGVYSVCVRGTDTAQNETVVCGPLLAVYDPSAGFVTGAGWIESPQGAYTADPALSGKATFGFVSKYQRGATLPNGKTEFQFHAAGMNFKSTDYEWLVIAGARAQFKGSGQIGGTGDYAFLLTGIDSQISGGGESDRFRIKIWEKLSGVVIYDNQLGKLDTGNDATALGGGSIIIHQQ